MRKVIDLQFKIGESAIGDIQFDPCSRDEIPKVLMGLQGIYCNRNIREQVFEVLMDIIPDDVDTFTDRCGMDLWKILVLGTMRLSCNWDYDKLLDIANNYRTLRLMLGHSAIDQESRYVLQTLKDNISLFTPEVLDRINQTVVDYGHEVIGKTAEEKLRASCDSFVVETDVHFPTDINLLFDAMQKTIILIMSLSNSSGLSGWRQGSFLLKKVKLSAINKAIENSDEFKEVRRKHSAVESSIKALENHGLDRCLDHGLHEFKRYVSLAVLARNIQIIGHVLQQRQLADLQRLKKLPATNRAQSCSRYPYRDINQICLRG